MHKLRTLNRKSAIRDRLPLRAHPTRGEKSVAVFEPKQAARAISEPPALLVGCGPRRGLWHRIVAAAWEVQHPRHSAARHHHQSLRMLAKRRHDAIVHPGLGPSPTSASGGGCCGKVRERRLGGARDGA